MFEVKARVRVGGVRGTQAKEKKKKKKKLTPR